MVCLWTTRKTWKKKNFLIATDTAGTKKDIRPQNYQGSSKKNIRPNSLSSLATERKIPLDAALFKTHIGRNQLCNEQPDRYRTNTQRLFQWMVPEYRSGRHLVDDHCSLCKNSKGTIGHILGSWDFALNNNRYTWRHDQILEIISNTVGEEIKSKDRNWEIYDDLKNPKKPQVRALIKLFDSSLRSDLIALNEEKKSMTIMELTVPMESSINHSETSWLRSWFPRSRSWLSRTVPGMRNRLLEKYRLFEEKNSGNSG